MTETTDPGANLSAALEQPDASARLQAALTAGTHPDPAYLEPLVARCAAEPDFSVREMLTWALTRLPHDVTLDRVLAELGSQTPQARAQALHTISKLRDERAWPSITVGHLHDSDDEVARTAWRTAAGLAPESARSQLAHEPSLELGRGDFAMKRSLSRALAELGDAALATVSGRAADPETGIAAHARATLRVIDDPEATFYIDD